MRAAPARAGHHRHGAPLWWALVVVTLISACDAAPPLPEIRRLRYRRLTRGQSAVPWPVILEGKHLTTSRAAPLRFTLLRVEPPWPRVRVALVGLRLESDARALAEVPAGIPPGHYRLEVRRGPRWRLAPQRIRVEPDRPNRAPAALSTIQARRAVTGEGGRLVLTGANLHQPLGVTLRGPGRQHIPLSHLHSVRGTRMLARLPTALAPGRYTVGVSTRTHGEGTPGVRFDVAPPPAGHPRTWHFGWLALLLAGAAIGTWCFARPHGPRRRAALSLVLVASACLAPMALLALLA